MKEPIFGAIAIVALYIGFTALMGGYNDVQWGYLVPLFKTLIPYLFVIGFPLIIILAAIIIVKTGKTGAHLVADIAKQPPKRPR